MTDMVERIARAIYEEEWRSPITGKAEFYAWEIAPQHMRDDAFALARAALEAMREPTAEMVRGAEEAIYPRHERGFLSKPLIDAPDLAKAYTGAVDAALTAGKR